MWRVGSVVRECIGLLESAANGVFRDSPCGTCARFWSCGAYAIGQGTQGRIGDCRKIRAGLAEVLRWRKAASVEKGWHGDRSTESYAKCGECRITVLRLPLGGEDMDANKVWCAHVDEDCCWHRVSEFASVGTGVAYCIVERVHGRARGVAWAFCLENVGTSPRRCDWWADCVNYVYRGHPWWVVRTV